MSLIDDLESFLAQKEEEEYIVQSEEGEAYTQEELVQKYHIIDPNQANYYIKMYKQILDKENELQAIANAEIKKVKDHVGEWLETELKKLQYPKSFYGSLLEAYAEESLKDSKKKSISLPNGVIGFKKQQDEYDYDDEVLKGYLQATAANYLIKVEDLKIDKKSLKKDIHFKDGVPYLGELPVEGLTVTKRENKFEIK